MSSSPSSVRWHFKSGTECPRLNFQLGDAWAIPSKKEIQRRFTIRKTIQEETLQHRRIHRHGGLGCSGRNIACLLQERQTYGRSGNPRRAVQLQTIGASPTSKGLVSDAGASEHKNDNIDNKNKIKAKKKKNRNSLNDSPRVSRLWKQIRTFGEYCSVVRYHSAFLKHLGGTDELSPTGQRPSSSHAVSTISIAFAPDHQTMASTHGDHTVKITATGDGRLLRTLEGHPRTPWTVKYHPTNSELLASGCLGHQVRVWNWKIGSCLQMIRLEFAIISLSFHPTGQVLAIANGTRLHFWELQPTASSSSSGGNSTQQRRGMLTEVEQRHMLRCVHFPPDGDTLIVGGVNNNNPPPPTTGRRGGISGGGMSFYLKLWDFDLEAALQPLNDPTTTGLRRRAISNPRTFVPRALLYNDGGFDVSPDGKVLCACAEYWLPEGVDNVMEFLQQHGHEEDNSDSEEDQDEELKEIHDDGRDFADSKAESPPRRQPQNLTSPTTSSFQRQISSPTPQTPPPNPTRPHLTLSPPSPPGRRFAGGLGQQPPSQSSRAIEGTTQQPQGPSSQPTTTSTSSQLGRTSNPRIPATPGISKSFQSFLHTQPSLEANLQQPGRYVPHVVTISLDTLPLLVPSMGNNNNSKNTPNGKAGHNESASQLYSDSVSGRSSMRNTVIPRPTTATKPFFNKQTVSLPSHSHRHHKFRPRLGQLLQACPLDGTKASAVTCVKFSPSTDFCLIGYGVREPLVDSHNHNAVPYHPVTALYRIVGGMTHVSTMLSSDDDVNIARFHPDSGYGFVYGTKQGRVRVLSPRPWNYYNC